MKARLTATGTTATCGRLASQAGDDTVTPIASCTLRLSRSLKASTTRRYRTSASPSSSAASGAATRERGISSSVKRSAIQPSYRAA